MVKIKKPWIAALLNLIFFGLGYIYNGKRIRFGLGLVSAWVLILAGVILIYFTHAVFDEWTLLFSGLVVLQFSFGIDGYNETKDINKKE